MTTSKGYSVDRVHTLTYESLRTPHRPIEHQPSLYYIVELSVCMTCYKVPTSFVSEALAAMTLPLASI